MTLIAIKKFRYAHRLLGPRTAFLITTIDKLNKPNIAVASNVVCVSSDSQVIGLAMLPEWQTSQNILATKEFAIGLIDARFLDNIWIAGNKYSGVNLRKGSDKFVASGFHKLSSQSIKSPTVKEAVATVECRLLDHIDIGGNQLFFMGKVVGATYDPEFVSKDLIPNLDKIQPIQQISREIFGRSVPNKNASTKRSQRLADENIKEE